MNCSAHHCRRCLIYHVFVRFHGRSQFLFFVSALVDEQVDQSRPSISQINVMPFILFKHSYIDYKALDKWNIRGGRLHELNVIHSCVSIQTAFVQINRKSDELTIADFIAKIKLCSWFIRVLKACKLFQLSPGITQIDMLWCSWARNGNSGRQMKP
jgi:hypothetical protein